MKKAIADKWVKALRSGDYKQGRGKLRHNGNFCCLGVLCNLHAQAHPKIAAQQGRANWYMGENTELPSEVMYWAGMNDASGYFDNKTKDSLIDLNDAEGYSFVQIADVIDKEWKAL